MIGRLRFGEVGTFYAINGFRTAYNYQQKFNLVNVKLKWAKDSVLDGVVAGQRDLKASCIIVSLISHNPNCCSPVYHLSRHRGLLGLPQDLKVSTFIRRYPSIFHEFHVLDSGGTRVPWFSLTPEALELHHEEANIFQQNKLDLLSRLQKLLMLTRDKTLPLQTIDQLHWDLGFPYDYRHSVIPHHPNLFSLTTLPDSRVGLKLLIWDERLAVSQLQSNAPLQQKEEDIINGTLAFPISFTRGFGLKRKWMKWLEDWKALPYTSPYSDSSCLDPRTDVSEKRIVGVFHELLHLTIGKKTERINVSNLRKPLGLPQKFTKVFERHPGIFYISNKSDTQTVVLREAYRLRECLQKHPLAEIRDKFACTMKKGRLDRSRGLYKKSVDACLGEDPLEAGALDGEPIDNHSTSEGDLFAELAEYDSDDIIHKFD